MDKHMGGVVFWTFDHLRVILTEYKVFEAGLGFGSNQFVNADVKLWTETAAVVFQTFIPLS